MKFKITVIGILTAILAVCCFTSYKLIQIEEARTATIIEIEEERTTALIEESKKTTAYSRIAAYIAIEQADYEREVEYAEKAAKYGYVINVDTYLYERKIENAKEKYRELNDGLFVLN